ncbi:MAG: hypothetical protein MUC87_17890 [Bacteroidia bacterium]|jgi:hypothetical protein|nr:hypothetical protein [Bacteroidia bacterium]
MKAFKFIALVGALSLTFMGCPYESKVPVDDASNAKTSKALEGVYEERSSEDYTYVIKADGNQYRITKKKKSGEDEPTVYIGFVSKVGSGEYLNIREEGSSSDTKYYIYKVDTKSEGRIKLKGVTDNITEEFATSAELRAFIQKYENLSFFFDKDEDKTFYKED